MPKSLSILSIDCSTFFEENDIDLTCTTCKGTGTVAATTPIINTGTADDDAVCALTNDAIEKGDEVFWIGNDTERLFSTEENAEDWHKENSGEEDCEECEGGSISVIWNTIFNTGFHSASVSLPAQIGPVVAFEYDDHVWFGLAGCGQDCSPQFIRAWFECFPDCTWVPDNWINHVNLFGGYYGSEVGVEVEDKLLRLLKEGYEYDIRRGKADLAELNAFLKRRKAKEKAKPKAKKAK